MPAPFMIAAAAAGSSWITSMWLNKVTVGEGGTLEPKIAGMDADWFLAGAGLLAALILPPFWGALGLGAGAAGLINLDLRKRYKEAAEKFVAAQLMSQSPAGYLRGDAEVPPYMADAFAPAAYATA